MSKSTVMSEKGPAYGFFIGFYKVKGMSDTLWIPLTFTRVVSTSASKQRFTNFMIPIFLKKISRTFILLVKFLF